MIVTLENLALHEIFKNHLIKVFAPLVRVIIFHFQLLLQIYVSMCKIFVF